MWLIGRRPLSSGSIWSTESSRTAEQRKRNDVSKEKKRLPQDVAEWQGRAATVLAKV